MTPDNKQRWMGGLVLLGGGALLAALLLKGDGQDALMSSATTDRGTDSRSAATNPFAEAETSYSDTDFTSLDADQSAMPASDETAVHLRPLEMDVQTEQRLLEEQRAARAKQVAEQEARTAEFLAKQQ
ncbi:MAG: hypothetical protein VXW65_15220, partial [Pseudomonadota bacterium]|nr:hypothetical protein [Pseudomonadota bacterium]